MDTSRGYVLLLGAGCEASKPVQNLLQQRHCPVFVARSVEQAVARVEQGSPYLMILSGTHQNWSPMLVHQLRQQVRSAEVTIVALTEFSESSWLPHEDYPDIDGFLVTPLSYEVLTSLVESALVKTGF